MLLPMSLRLLVAVLLGALTLPLRAQPWHKMDNPEAVRSGLEANAARVYRFKPASNVRPLPPAPDNESTRPVISAVQSFARGTYGTLLLENGLVLFEGYGQGAQADSMIGAYSVTKSWTALAVGEALCAGRIKSLDDLAQVYAPQLQGTAYGRASVRDLLRYTSGAEDPGGNGYIGIHNLRDFNAMVEHRMSLAELIGKHGAPSRFKPGEKFIYNGLDSEALSLVVREATGQPLQAWFEATVWQEAGGESSAAWFVDSEGNGIAEVLVFATARDFARIGLYVLERLTDQAGSACMRQFVKEAASPLVAKGYWQSAPAYGMGLHTGADGQVWMFGYNGQRIGVRTDRRRVFVTTNNRDGEAIDRGSQSLLSR